MTNQKTEKLLTIITDEEINKAFEGAFDKDVYIHHGRTLEELQEEIFLIRLRAVAQAQLEADQQKEKLLEEK